MKIKLSEKIVISIKGKKDFLILFIILIIIGITGAHSIKEFITMLIQVSDSNSYMLTGLICIALITYTINKFKIKDAKKTLITNKLKILDNNKTHNKCS